MDLMPADAIDRAAAQASIPPLLRGYLRLGGFVGEGAFIDHDFNTTDVCLIMDTSAMSDKHRDFYTRKAPRA
jgi:L-ornithine Nalpha-acyltransferase